MGEGEEGYNERECKVKNKHHISPLAGSQYVNGKEENL